MNKIRKNQDKLHSKSSNQVVTTEKKILKYKTAFCDEYGCRDIFAAFVLALRASYHLPRKGKE